MNIFRSALEEKIATLISKALSNLGYDLVRVRLNKGSKRNSLEIMFERIDGASVSINDCEILNRAISPILDVEDPINGAYVLKVSSPGLDKPLTREKDLLNSIESSINVSVKTSINNRRNFSGILKAVNSEDISLQIKDSDEVIIILKSNIANANLIFQW
jgi:ribosome maturation factor RimP